MIDRILAPLRGLVSGGRKSSVVAIDVASRGVHAVHVRREGAELVLDGYRVTHVGDGKGQVRSAEDGVRDALALRMGGDAVAFSITHSGAAIRKAELPPMSRKELHEALPWEARRQISDLPADAVVGAQILDEGGDGLPMEILMVAFPREEYERVISTAGRLGVDPVFVDVGQLAAMNALGRSHHRPPAALLDLGRDEAAFSIFRNDDLILYRDLSSHVIRLDGLLAQTFRLDPAALEVFKTNGKLPDGQTATPGQIEEALVDVVHDLSSDIREGLVFLENKTGTALEHLFLVGGNATFLHRNGIMELLGAQTGVPVERYNPFDDYRLGLIDEMGLKSAFPELCAAAGVAARYLAV